MAIERPVMLEVLKDSYSAYYTIVEDVEETGLPLAFRADYKARDEQYFFTKSAKIWANEKNEYAYIFAAASFDPETVKKCLDYAWEDMLPRVQPHKEHQCTNAKAVFLADTLDADTIKVIRKASRTKNYHFGLQGFSNLLAGGVDLSTQKTYTNAAGNELADYFKGVRAKYLEDGTLNPISLTTDTQCLNYQIPGGMLSNLLSQLEMLNALDKFDEALKETPRVREDLGFPPLVTPTSQLVGTQAVQNVLAGERYKNVGAEIKAYCRGEYGKTPAPINPEIREKILQGDPIVEGRYAETLPDDAYDQAAAEIGDTARCEEDVLSYIAFPQVAEKFFAERTEREERKVAYSIKKVED